jgi:hypothetical protein
MAVSNVRPALFYFAVLREWIAERTVSRQILQENINRDD